MILNGQLKLIRFGYGIIILNVGDVTVVLILFSNIKMNVEAIIGYLGRRTIWTPLNNEHECSEGASSLNGDLSDFERRFERRSVWPLRMD